MNPTKEKLIEKRKELIARYNELDYYSYYYKLTKEQEDELQKIIKEIKKLDLEIFEIERNKGSNGTIYIYQSTKSNPYEFDICLNENNNKIGNIIVQPAAYYFNIACTIYEEYRGNGYFFQALCLLVNYLYYEEGVQRIELFAENDNIPSLKTIEKFNNIIGATEIENDGTETTYYYELNEKNMPLQNESYLQRK